MVERIEESSFSALFADRELGSTANDEFQPEIKLTGRLEDLAKGFCLHGEPEFPLPLRKCF